MKISLGEIMTREPAIAWGLGICAVNLLIQWLLVGLFIWQLPPEIPLWYSLPSGKMQLASPPWLLVIPGLSMIFFMTNLITMRWGQTLISVRISMMTWLSALMLCLATVAMIHIIALAL